MVRDEIKAAILAAERIYESRLRAQLDPAHRSDYVAIEPVSGEHFLGTTLAEAMQAARGAYPGRIPAAFRIGERTAVHLGRLT